MSLPDFHVELLMRDSCPKRSSNRRDVFLCTAQLSAGTQRMYIHTIYGIKHCYYNNNIVVQYLQFIFKTKRDFIIILCY